MDDTAERNVEQFFKDLCLVTAMMANPAEPYNDAEVEQYTEAAQRLLVKCGFDLEELEKRQPTSLILGVDDLN